MSSLLDSVKGMFLGAGVGDDDYDEEYEYYEEEEYEEEPPRRQRAQKQEPLRRGSAETRQDTNVVSFGNMGEKTNIIISFPKNLKDASRVADHIKNGKIVVVNLVGVEKLDSQRIADFLGGISYALSGDMERISNEVFIVGSSQVDIDTELKEDINTELKSRGINFFWGNK